MTSLANAFEPSRRAAAPVGPNAPRPRCRRPAPPPATSGASGPTTVSPTSSRSASATMPSTSVAATAQQRASPAMPGLPGVHSSSGACGERRSARTIACSRPPAPTTRTFTLGRLQGGDEVVDRDRDERLVARRPARAELERHARHRALVGRLDHADEVELAQGRPLGLDGRAELLDLLVDLADPLRVVLDGLNALRGQRREHDVGRHRTSRVAAAGQVPARSIPFARRPVAWPPLTLLAQLSDPHVAAGPADTRAADALAAAVAAVADLCDTTRPGRDDGPFGPEAID